MRSASTSTLTGENSQTAVIAGAGGERAARRALAAQQGLDSLGVMAEAEGGLTKVRRLIIMLALRGRFSAVDPQTAAVLHERGWQERPLSECVEVLDGRRVPVNEAERSARIAGKDQKDLFPYFGATRQQGWIDDYLFDEELVLLGEDGVPFRDPDRPKAYVVRGKTWVNNHAHVLRPHGLDAVFLCHSLNVADYSERVTGTTRAKLTQRKMLDIPITVPPLAEQKRIVAKVDELIALCDDLEARQTKKRETGTRLTKSALQALTTAESPEAFDLAWKRVVENFDVLIDRAEKVGDLRRIVLECAMRGALVPRAAHGLSTSQLLDDAGRRLHRARTDAQRKRIDAIAPVSGDEHPPLPDGWLAVRWCQVGHCQNGRAFPSSEYSDAGVRLLRPGNIHVSGEVRWTQANTRYLPHHFADEYPEFIVRGCELIMNLTAQSLNDEFLGRVSETAPDDVCLLNQRLARLTPFAFDRRFLLWFFRAPFFRRYVDELNQGTLIQHMFTKQVDAAVVFLPPLEEQRQIGERIDQLMKVCDDLEARFTRAEERAAQLVEAVVRDLVV
jgi:type I restriction enzyme, S subunit